MRNDELAPVLSCPLGGGARSTAKAVEAVLGPRGLSGMARAPSPATLEMLGLALIEALESILELSGGRWIASGAAVELWTAPSFIVVAVRFSGVALPEWLLTNWDRKQELAVPAPSSGCDCNWLMVREAFDSVDHDRCADGQLLFLEKRL